MRRKERGVAGEAYKKAYIGEITWGVGRYPSGPLLPSKFQKAHTCIRGEESKREKPRSEEVMGQDVKEVMGQDVNG